MKILSNYKVLEELGESLHSTVFKVSPADNPEETVILRKVKEQTGLPESAKHLQRQINRLKALALPHITTPELHHPSQESLFLISPYFDGISLTSWLREQPGPSLEDSLKIIIAITERLVKNHAAGLIHGGISPNNVLINPSTLEIQLIDLVRVIDINQASHFIDEETFCSQNLPYLSPEQLNRVSCSIDYTTDLYSLGIVLYELLTAKPPFSSSDPIKVIHSHLAETAPLVHECNPKVPEPISRIVTILLEKAMEKRYQSGLGLLHDLKSCLAEWVQTHQINSFTLKKKDFSNQITLPSLMVGRDSQKESLLEAYQESASGHFQAAFVSGLSGIGKTRLIQELQLPIVMQRGYFTSGKFDQFEKHIPYSSLIQAIKKLIRTFLTESSKQIAYWHHVIKEAIGESGKLITDLIPELKLIIGPQPALVELPPVESRNRFNDIAGRFLACLASERHPLTFFIDDLQWCDSATFDLLEQTFDSPHEYPFFFLVGAYRHNEIDRTHRLAHLIEKAKQKERPLLEIRLKPLGIREVNQMTAYILNTYSSRTHALSKVIYQTSSGNPLFVNESLQWLHRHQHLHLNDDGVWSWDSEKLQHAQTPSSALDLFKEKIEKLPTESLELIEIAACLGARFDLKTLALVAQLECAQLLKALTEAFSNNILQQDKDQLCFFHDQVQAAAASFINPKELLDIHARIAKALISEIPTDQPLETLPNLFAIVEHLANSRPDKQSRSEKLEESKFNYHAGLAAMEALAMENANHFFRESKALYPDDSWEDDYHFLFSLHKQLARSEIALGNQLKSEQYLDALLEQCRDDFDKADCLYEQTASLSSLGNFRKAIVLGNSGLNYFSAAIPEDGETALAEASKIMDALHAEDRNIWQQLLNAPESESRSAHIESAIYSELIPDYYLAGMVPQLYLAAIRSAKNGLTNGISESIIYSFPIIGLYLQQQDRYDLSHRYETLALDLAERYPNSFGATKGINGVLWINSHNHHSPQQIINLCEQNIHRGKSCGDLYNAGLSYAPYIWNLVTQGDDIEKIATVSRECITFSKKFNLHLSLGIAEGVLAGWNDVINSDPQQKLNHSDIESRLKQWEEEKHVVSIGCYYTLSGISNHYLGHYKIAATQLEKARPFLKGLSDNILNRLWFVFRYLNGLQLPKEGDIEEKELMDRCLERVETWAALGPILGPYLAFMRAEKARCSRSFQTARAAYLDAIDRAHEAKYSLLEGYLSEQLGRLLDKAQHRYAPFHLKKARSLYRRCGAGNKQAQIEQQFAVLLTTEEPARHPTLSLENRLDIDYLTAATRDITQQTDFEPLIKTILQSIMARLGAKTGYLLIAEKEVLSIIAKATKQDQVKVEMQRENHISHENLSPAIANYVLRMGETLVLENAQQKGAFKTDSIVQEQALKSLLCLPLMKQNRVLGLLYFENNLIESVFTPTQIELAQTLTAQAAITLENSLLIRSMTQRQEEIQKLNEELEIRVAERTESLNKSNDELKNFAYVVSHDLKAPLRAINQLSSWIAEDYAEVLDHDGREQLLLLQNRAQRMHAMIDGILQYSRISQQTEPNETIDIKKLLDDVIDGLAPAKNIQLEIQPDLPIIRGERIRLFQIFQNLIDNAIKYNDKAHMKIAISFESSLTEWQFCVSDNGPGIDEKYHQQIFQLFQTLSPKEQAKGTGIGLSMIEKIIHRWKGKIWIESVIGQGCQFFFTLPKEDEIKHDQQH